MKSHLLAALLLPALAVVGCRKPPPSLEEMNPRQRAEYYRSHLNQAVLEQCTNDVPGIRAVIRTGIAAEGDAVVNWSALPTLDYVNRAGGIERTNLHLKFNTLWNGAVIALNDSEYYQSQLRAEIAARNRSLGLEPDGTLPTNWLHSMRSPITGSGLL